MTTDKRATVDVTLSSATLAEAEALGVDVSRAAEAGVAAAARAERQRRWKEENREAMEQMKVWVEENGLPLSELRKF
ncbi:type II toxin-antitoxin system CcdA family antitoxin [Oceanicola granulosus]|uniref:type II toxin-antitoxin system CcdA family antitoxin n=1 Tax=Oceanicola granulosus TaxID=252302 RepID=UPI001FDF0BD1|nr:type II toxin-antitoxin system CcdA family antitoxin [Oceanicola granulosus]